MRSISDSRKGNAIIDSLFVILVALVFAIFSYVGYIAFTDINTDIQNDDILSEDNQAVFDTLHNRTANVLDGLFIFFFVFAWIAGLVASFQISTHPIFFVFSIVLIVAVLFVGIELANFYDDLGQDAEFSDTYTAFPMTNAIMNNLVVILVCMLFSISLALYAKSKYGDS